MRCSADAEGWMDPTLTSRVAVAINTHRAEVDEMDVQTGLDDAAEDVVRRAEVVLDRVPVVVVWLWGEGRV